MALNLYIAKTPICVLLIQSGIKEKPINQLINRSINVYLTSSDNVLHFSPSVIIFSLALFAQIAASQTQPR